MSCPTILHKHGVVEDGGGAKYWTKAHITEAPSQKVYIIFIYLEFKNQTDQRDKNTLKLFFQWIAKKEKNIHWKFVDLILKKLQGKIFFVRSW